jgi:molybdopterin-binding protein
MSLLTVRVAASRLGIGYSTLKQWIFKGRVRTTQTEGGHHRIAESEIDRLLARHAPDVPAKKPSRRATSVVLALSGRNRLRGYVEEVRTDGLMGQIRLRVGDQTLTAVITADAIAELKLKRGDDALAIIKSTEVMIAKEAPEATHRAGGAGRPASAPKALRRGRAQARGNGGASEGGGGRVRRSR